MLILLSGTKNSGKSLCTAFLAERGWHSFSFAKALKDLIAKVYELSTEERKLLDGLTPKAREWKEQKNQKFTPLNHESSWTPIVLLEVLEELFFYDTKFDLFSTCIQLELLLQDHLYPFNLSPREALQIIGTDIFRTISEDVWIDQIDLTYLDTFGNDIPSPSTLLTENQNVIISDCRFENEFYWAKELGGHLIFIDRSTNTQTDHHVSENLHQLKSLADSILINNGSVQDLKANLFSILKEYECTKHPKR
jgi:hypothetical protein